MAAFIQGSQLRQIEEGIQVTKSVTLPTSATTATLFTVTGGAIIVKALLGVVTTTVGSTATTLALGTAPTTGTLDTDGIATATAITSSEAGVWVTPQASAGLAGALVVSPIGGNIPFLATRFIVPAGTITWTTSANAGGGVFTWYLMYVPLDTGASAA